MQDLHKLLLFQLLTFLGQHAHGSEIIDGKIAPENSMLYMASVQDDRGHVCGGFLVSEDFVMTAAHCDDMKPTRVVVGTHNIKYVDSAKIIPIKYRYKPESYESVGKGNDIMLLKLSQKPNLDNKLQIVHLPIFEIHINENQNCQVAGWGYTETDGRVVEDLRVVDVSVISPRVCIEKWTSLPDNVICAGGYKTHKGFCQGDSGGPLVCNGIAVGIVSFNRFKNCSYPHVPNVYTEISKYLPWIKSILMKKN